MSRFGLAILCWLALLAVPIQADTILVLAPANSPLAAEFAQALQNERTGDVIEVRSLDDPHPAVPASLIITMGQAALERHLKQSLSIPTIATYVSASSLSQPGTDNLPDSLQLLLANPKPARQIALAKVLIPHLQSIGLPYSTLSQAQLQEWADASKQAGLILNASKLDSPEQLNRRLASILDRSDVLIGLDDQQIYNADNLKTILLTSYARNRVLIGPSAPFIAAGSLSTSFSSPADMARSVNHLLNLPWANGRISYPRHFSILSNQQVARSLGFPPLDDARLATRLAELEKP